MFPYSEQGALNTLFKNAEVITTEYLDEGTLVYAWVDERTKGMLSKFIK